jgi:hypothetical protein
MAECGPEAVCLWGPGIGRNLQSRTRNILLMSAFLLGGGSAGAI